MHESDRLLPGLKYYLGPKLAVYSTVSDFSNRVENANQVVDSSKGGLTCAAIGTTTKGLIDFFGGRAFVALAPETLGMSLLGFTALDYISTKGGDVSEKICRKMYHPNQESTSEHESQLTHPNQFHIEKDLLIKALTDAQKIISQTKTPPTHPVLNICASDAEELKKIFTENKLNVKQVAADIEKKLVYGDKKSEINDKAELSKKIHDIHQWHLADHKKREEVKFQDNVQTSLQFVHSLAQLGGNRTLAKITEAGMIGLQSYRCFTELKAVAQGVSMAAAVATTGMATTAATSLAAFAGPIAGLGLAAISLINILNEPDGAEENNALEIIHQQLNMLIQLQQIMRVEMHQRFDQVDKKLNEIFKTICTGFELVLRKVTTDNHEMRAYLTHSLNHIDAKLNKVNQDLKSRIDESILNNLKEKIHSVTSKRITRTKYKTVVDKFVYWLEAACRNPIYNGSAYASQNHRIVYKDADVCELLTSHLPENFIAANIELGHLNGFLLQFIQLCHPQDFKNIDASKLPNAVLWLTVSESLLALMTLFPEEDPGDLSSVIKSGQEVINPIEKVRNTPVVFQSLIANHINKLGALLNLIDTFVEKENGELNKKNKHHVKINIFDDISSRTSDFKSLTPLATKAEPDPSSQDKSKLTTQLLWRDLKDQKIEIPPELLLLERIGEDEIKVVWSHKIRNHPDKIKLAWGHSPTDMARLYTHPHGGGGVDYTDTFTFRFNFQEQNFLTLKYSSRFWLAMDWEMFSITDSWEGTKNKVSWRQNPTSDYPGKALLSPVIDPEAKHLEELKQKAVTKIKEILKQSKISIAQKLSDEASVECIKVLDGIEASYLLIKSTMTFVGIQLTPDEESILWSAQKIKRALSNEVKHEGSLQTLIRDLRETQSQQSALRKMAANIPSIIQDSKRLHSCSTEAKVQLNLLRLIQQLTLNQSTIKQNAISSLEKFIKPYRLIATNWKVYCGKWIDKLGEESAELRTQVKQSFHEFQTALLQISNQPPGDSKKLSLWNRIEELCLSIHNDLSTLNLYVTDNILYQLTIPKPLTENDKKTLFSSYQQFSDSQAKSLYKMPEGKAPQADKKSPTTFFYSKERPLLQGSFKNKIIKFEEYETLGNGRCGFYSIGVSPEEVVQTLLKQENNEVARRELAEEIEHTVKQDIAMGNSARWQSAELKDLALPQRIVQHYLSPHNKDDKQAVEKDAKTQLELKSFSLHPAIYRKYVSDFERQGAWLGCKSAKLVAQYSPKPFNLCVWERDPTKPGIIKIRMADSFLDDKIVDLRHIYFTNNCTHFNLLGVIGMDTESVLDSKSNIHNHKIS